MSFFDFSRFTQTVADTLLSLYPPPASATPSVSRAPLSPSQAPRRTTTRNTSEITPRQVTGAPKPRPAPQPIPRAPSQPERKKTILCSPSEALQTTLPQLAKPTRASQVTRNSTALSSKEPIKSCFRKCRANESFGLPSLLPLSTRPRRRVVFSDPINDGGNYPRHAPIFVPEEERDELTPSLDACSAPLVFSKGPRVALHPSSTPIPIRKIRVTSLPRPKQVVKVESPPLSRLKLRPMPDHSLRQRVVAYSFTTF
ncbi:hypothetical protein JCM16303_004685 [Sporobolomyces ruberrimus]